jgi:hypothetical protein
MFYNTINVQGYQLQIDFENQTTRQEDVVLNIYQSNNKALTPMEVHGIAESKGFNWPITSIRRAISDLTKQEKLKKLTEMKDEQYGKPNHKWVINQKTTTAK